MNGWIMAGIVLFVVLAVTALWFWFIIQWRDKLPGVRMPTYRELFTDVRRGVDAYRYPMRNRSRSRRDRWR